MARGRRLPGCRPSPAYAGGGEAFPGGYPMLSPGMFSQVWLSFSISLSLSLSPPSLSPLALSQFVRVNPFGEPWPFGAEKRRIWTNSQPIACSHEYSRSQESSTPVRTTWVVRSRFVRWRFERYRGTAPAIDVQRV